MPGDLHTHTTFSDGALRADVLVRLAQRAGLRYLAISDHDSCLSVRYAMEQPQRENLQLLPATELTAFDSQRGRRVHILCYFPDDCQALRQFCDTMAARRNAVCRRSMEELEQLYPQFDRETALSFAADSGVLYKTHLIRVLYEYGYTDGIYKDLYQQLFGSKGGKVLHDPAYESVDMVLDVIRQSWGVAVLAHPSVYRTMELAGELAAAGRIDGVEIFHPRNTPEDQRTLAAMAEQYGLLVTGGTDFHGMHSSRPVPLGSVTADDENIGRLLQLAQSRKG